MEQGSVRNLEQIQEYDGEARTPRSVTILLVALGGACIVFAGLALGGRRSVAPVAKADPLGELVGQQAKAGQGTAPKPGDLSARDVTFPGILSDEASPTTALAAVRGGPVTRAKDAKETKDGKPLAAARIEPTSDPRAKGAPAEMASEGDVDAIGLNVRPSSAGAPLAGDRLPVVPLPAQNVLDASPLVTRPRDALTRAASDAAQISSPAQASAPSGHGGGYQLQVSSFRTQAEAEQFATQLRARGHKAYVAEAHVAGRGTWYRVRVGPFSSQQAAAAYRSEFESKEHVVPFIVQPQK